MIGDGIWGLPGLLPLLLGALDKAGVCTCEDGTVELYVFWNVNGASCLFEPNCCACCAFPENRVYNPEEGGLP